MEGRLREAEFEDRVVSDTVWSTACVPAYHGLESSDADHFTCVSCEWNFWPLCCERLPCQAQGGAKYKIKPLQRELHQALLLLGFQMELNRVLFSFLDMRFR